MARTTTSNDGEAARTSAPATSHRTAVYSNVDYLEVLRRMSAEVFRIAQCALENLFKESCAAIRITLEERHRVVRILSADKIRKGSHLSRTDRRVSMTRPILRTLRSQILVFSFLCFHRYAYRTTLPCRHVHGRVS